MHQLRLKGLEYSPYFTQAGNTIVTLIDPKKWYSEVFNWLLPIIAETRVEGKHDWVEAFPNQIGEPEKQLLFGSANNELASKNGDIS